MRISWTKEEVNDRLLKIMNDIHQKCVLHGPELSNGNVDYVSGANIAGFIKIADAMVAYGAV